MANTNRPGPDAGGSGRDMGFLVRLMLWLGVISVAFIIFVMLVPINPWLPEGTRQAVEVDDLFRFMIAASGVIFIYVQGFILAFALRYRRRRSEPDSAVGPPIHGNTRLETTWTVLPSLLLVVLTILSIRVWVDEHTTPADSLHLDVRGYQFGFAYSLPQYGIKDNSTVVLPVNRPVYVTQTSSDVIHAFWIPGFRSQLDMVPGIVTHQQYTPTRIGTYRVVCTQFCGSGHSGMISQVSVASQADFEAWVRKNGGKIPSSGAAAQLVQH